jgi:hypothetical protein
MNIEAKLTTHIFSLSEAAVKDAHEKDRRALFAHNMNHMMRAYPSGMRVNSSNMDPTFSWRQGIQIVALNWQNCDKGMMLNKGMFAGTNGWKLKPEEYRATTPPATEDSNKATQRRSLQLSLEVYAGQDLPLPDGDSHAKGFRPYVACHLHVERPKDGIHATRKDIDSDDSGNGAKYKRKTKSSSGIDPDFGGQTLQFPAAPGILEELSFLRSVKSCKTFPCPRVYW